ncbi:LysR substrate-binding domain-containing protein [Accumulibacter sp.]|uniref:LysR substrate-binding domain-containing protein n=1 Tax=Accumulibacter sp. TaxID=2053492 RepID=UPI0026354D05|nr:LysR substrate-binding domain-containing protein [Accumulibacter sp.]HRI93251.1 LysR substrate-binding domain-containing protein [Accumulibacter sp.]
MELNWLEDFLTLSITRNFSRAAELRNVTQPAFSRRIRNLEYWVGAVLIDRSLFPISLTPAGDAFRKTAQETLDNLRNGREEAQGLMPKSGEIVSIAASHTIAVSFFADWHAGLQASTGAIKARVIADNVAGCIEALLTGHCDLMLAYSSAALPTLAQMNRYPSAPLASERLVPVSAPESNGSARYALTGKATLPYLCYPGSSYLGRLTASVIDREDLAARLDFRYECSMSDVLKSGVLAGAGIAWIPELAVRNELAAGSLVHAGDDRHTAQLGISLYRQAELSRPEVERIWNVCVGAAAR